MRNIEGVRLRKISPKLPGSKETQQALESLRGFASAPDLHPVKSETHKALVDVRKTEDKRKVWEKLVEKYAQGGETALEDFLFNTDIQGGRPTKEQLMSDLGMQRELKKLFSKNKDGLTLTFDDFLISIPSEEDYVQNAVVKIANANEHQDQHGVAEDSKLGSLDLELKAEPKVVSWEELEKRLALKDDRIKFAVGAVERERERRGKTQMNKGEKEDVKEINETSTILKELAATRDSAPQGPQHSTGTSEALSSLKELSASRGSESVKPVKSAKLSEVDQELANLKELAVTRGSAPRASEHSKGTSEALSSLKELSASRGSESIKLTESDYEKQLKEQAFARAEKRNKESKRRAEFLAIQRQQRVEYATEQYVNAYKKYYPNFNAEGRALAVPPLPKKTWFSGSKFRELNGLYQNIIEAKKELEDYGIGEKIKSNVEKARQSYLASGKSDINFGVSFNDQVGGLSAESRKSIIKSARVNEDKENFNMHKQNEAEGVSFTEEGWYVKENPESASGVSTEPTKRVGLWGKVKGWFSKSK